MPVNPFKNRIWQVGGGRSLTLGRAGHLMGVLNITPDSFSDGGLHETPASAAAQAQRMAADGASIIDIGAESTRPGAARIDGDEERRRLLPALEAVVDACPQALVSIDTYRAATAEAALKAGAHIVNDVWGLQREPDIARVAADHGAGLVIMHTNREREALADVIKDQLAFFSRSLEIAAQCGVKDNAIILDPGFGFGKETAGLNLELMARFEALHQLGYPLLVGTSRKRFLGMITGRDAGDRDPATAATTVILREKGAAVFRVHDVAINRDALAVCDAMLAQRDHEALPDV